MPYPSTKHLESVLREYFSAIELAIKNDQNPTNQKKYQRHYEAAADMRKHLERGHIEQFVNLVESESRSYGWDYIEGDIGQELEEKYLHFRNSIAEPSK